MLQLLTHRCIIHPILSWPSSCVPWHQPHSGNRAIGTVLVGLKSVTAHIRSSLWLRSETTSLPRGSHAIRPHSVMVSSGEMSFRVLLARAGYSVYSGLLCKHMEEGKEEEKGKGHGKRPNPGFSPSSVVQSLYTQDETYVQRYSRMLVFPPLFYAK